MQTRRKRTHLAGLEFELPIVNEKNEPVNFEVIYQATDRFIDTFSFLNVSRDDNEHIYLAVDDKTGDGLSYDCSYNTLEFSFGKEEDMNVLYKRFCQYYTYIQKELRKEGHMLTGMGINPRYAVNQNVPVVSERYRMLFHHLSSYKKYGNSIPFHSYLNFGLFSCASQIQLDVEEEQVVPMLNTFTKLEPFKALILANSLWGENAEILCSRDNFWRNSLHGLNRHNVDMYNVVFDTTDEIVRYIKSMSLYCVEREGKYINFPPVVLSKYFSSDRIKGEYFDGNRYREITFHPEISDLQYLRSFKFEDLTFRGTVEFRSVCEQPVGEIMASGALHAGLMENIGELSEFLEKDTSIYHNGYNASELRRTFPQAFIWKGGETFKSRQTDGRRNGERKNTGGLHRRVWRNVMLHIENEYIREHLLDGAFGIEMESLRVVGDGMLSQTAHPFPGDAHIVRDFSENQTEINTGVNESIEAAIEELKGHTRRIQEKLKALPEPELLWPFSNPPYIGGEKDVPIAQFDGKDAHKTAYREYLSDKYGRYKMTFSGSHVNFSFSEDLLRADFALQSEPDFMKYKNKLYLELAQKMAVYGWILVAVTAASPIVDSSFMEKGVYGKSVFTGLSSVRCSELGYWNEFPPTFDYSDIDSYVNSIEKYVKNGLLKAPSELYYPIRLKPAGENNLISLRKNGINHIELRMFDLNPLTGAGIDARDVKFAQLLMVWLATMPSWYVSKKDQVNAVQNFKNAAHYDLKTVKIARTEKRARSIVHEALKVIGWMKEFYQGLKMDDVQQILDFEYEKFVDPEKRYAWQVRKQYQENYVEKGLILARQKQNMTV